MSGLLRRVMSDAELLAMFFEVQHELESGGLERSEYLALSLELYDLRMEMEKRKLDYE